MISDAVASALGAGVGGVVSGIAGLFGADSQSRNVRKTNEMNYKIAQETNANQLQIARENNEMQLSSMRENNAFNKQSAIDMFNLEAAYNSPQAQKERLLAAGINPATLYGQGGSVGGSVNASTPSASASGISPSMPNFVTPTMQTPPSVLNGMFGNIETLSRSLGNIAKAGVDFATKRKISATLQAEIDKIVADTENVKIQNQWNAFKMQLDKENLPRKQAKEIERIMSQIFSDYASGGAAQASIGLQEAQTRLAGQEFEKIREQRPWLLDNIKKLGVLYDEQADTEREEQDYKRAAAAERRAMLEVHSAEAFLKRSLAKTENVLRYDKKNEILQNIKNGKFGLVANMIDSYMRAAGYNQPIWNLGAQLADAFGNEFMSWFGKDEPKVKDFVDWFKQQAE